MQTTTESTDSSRIQLNLLANATAAVIATLKESSETYVTTHNMKKAFKQSMTNRLPPGTTRFSRKFGTLNATEVVTLKADLIK